MNKKKIFIAGDSFAANWKKKNSNLIGWVNLLEDKFDVTNCAEAGVSEYKIFLQLKENNLKIYDYIIISHTSPYRIPIYEHPIHKNDPLHGNCDLILSDVENHIYDKKIKIAYDFYKYFFHKEYFEHTHELIYRNIISLWPKSINISFFDLPYKEIINFNQLFQNNKGEINHLNQKGNSLVYKTIIKKFI